jgi:Phage integrase central domain/Arm DNA-binding domain
MRDNLTARQVETIRKPGVYCDGGGLRLKIMAGRDRYGVWVFRFMRAGKSREMSLGPISDVSLAEAREKAAAARQLLRDGKDPLGERAATKVAAKVEQLKHMTFREAADQFLATARVQDFKSDKHRKQWRSTIESYALPVLGDLPLQQIDSAIVLKALTPVWKRTPETGSRLRGRIERVIDWAKPLGLFHGDNPAALDKLKDHLPAKPKAKHHAAMPYSKLTGFMAELRQRDSVSARCWSSPS